MGTPLDNGMTSFLRCGQCHTFYVPSQGINFTTGHLAVYWTKPKPLPRSKPTPCDHPATKVERWNGEAWEPVPLADDKP